MHIKHNTTGDTIVEVLIALAVLGAVIIGAYSIASRSLAGIRASHERDEATAIAEGQLEVIREFIANQVIEFSDVLVSEGGGTALFAPDSDTMVRFGASPNDSVGFCVAPPAATGVQLLFPETEMQDFTQYPPDCVFGRYHVYINTNYRLDVVSALDYERITYTYKVNIVWERSGGGGVETLTIQDRFFSGK